MAAEGGNKVATVEDESMRFELVGERSVRLWLGDKNEKVRIGDMGFIILRSSLVLIESPPGFVDIFNQQKKPPAVVRMVCSYIVQYVPLSLIHQAIDTLANLQQSTINVKASAVQEVVPDAHESQHQQIWVDPINPSTASHNGLKMPVKIHFLV